jgi:hypothetical protein
MSSHQRTALFPFALEGNEPSIQYSDDVKTAFASWRKLIAYLQCRNTLKSKKHGEWGRLTGPPKREKIREESLGSGDCTGGEYTVHLHESKDRLSGNEDCAT